MSTVTFFVGVQVPNITDELRPPDVYVGKIDGSNMERIKRYTVYGFDWVNDDLEQVMLEVIQNNYSVGGCHGWVKKYESPIVSPEVGKTYLGGGHFTIYEYDFDRYSELFYDESDKRAEDWSEAGQNA